MLTIRPVTDDDLLHLHYLYQQMDGGDALSQEKLAQLYAEIEQIPRYTIYLAYHNDVPVGTFSLLILPTPMHRGYHRSALLDAVTVLPTYRGQGIGRSMLQWALQKAQTAGCYKVMLSANLVRDRAHSFYQSLGFTQHGWSFSLALTPETAPPPGS